MMAKNSFVLYADYMEMLEELEPAQQGDLLMAIMRYVATDEIPELEAPETRVAFKAIKKAIDADAAKYEKTKEVRREAGAKGGKQRVANQANATFASNDSSKTKQSQANQAVTVTVTDTVTDTYKTVSIESAREGKPRLNEFLDAYPKKTKAILTVSDAYMTETQHEDEERLIQAAKNYAEAVKILGTEARFIKNPDRFIKDHTYFDYLPENYIRPKPKIKANAFNSFESNEYDFDALERKLTGG